MAESLTSSDTCACGSPLPVDHDETQARLSRAQHTKFKCRSHPYLGRDAEGKRLGQPIEDAGGSNE